MALVKIPAHAWELGLDPRSSTLLISVHVLAVAGLVYLFSAFNMHTALLAIILFFLCHLAIRVGAHSLYTHRAYEASIVWHAAMILLFSATIQGPLKVWTALHVRHHQFTDGLKDPYSPAHGWLWAHMLWGCFNLPQISVRDAMWMFRGKTPAEQRIVKLVTLQSEWPLLGGLLTGILVPGIIASLWGDFWGGIFVAGFLRLALQYHCTWQINSISHVLGGQPYGDKNSSRNSPWWLFGILSLLSVGEASGHNRHHKYAKDFRIGVGYLKVDPGKWLLYSARGFSRLLRSVGLPPLVWNLRRFDENGTLSELE